MTGIFAEMFGASNPVQDFNNRVHPPLGRGLFHKPVWVRPIPVERPDPYPDVDRVSRTPLQVGLSLPDPPSSSILCHREPDAFETISAMIEGNKRRERKERSFADHMMENLMKSGRYKP